MGLWRGFGDCDPNIYLATNVDLAAKCAPYSFIALGIVATPTQY